MKYDAIIKRAIVTEKSSQLIEDAKKYVFEVDRLASKGQVKKAIEDIYGVKVEDVHTLATRSKLKRSFANRKRKVYLSGDIKKAIVKLTGDSKLNLFEEDKKGK